MDDKDRLPLIGGERGEKVASSERYGERWMVDKKPMER